MFSLQFRLDLALTNIGVAITLDVKDLQIGCLVRQSQCQVWVTVTVDKLRKRLEHLGNANDLKNMLTRRIALTRNQSTAVGMSQEICEALACRFRGLLQQLNPVEHCR